MRAAPSRWRSSGWRPPNTCAWGPHQLAPVTGLHFDVVVPGFGSNPLPGRVAIGVADGPSQRTLQLGMPSGLAALHQLPPVTGLYFDVVFPGLGSNPLPGRVAIGIADVLYLIEARDRIPNVLGVVDWFLPLPWERELLGRNAVLLFPGR